MSRMLPLAAVCLALYAPQTLALELEDVVTRIERSVVRIDGGDAMGSGVVVDDAGLVLTNFHVIDGMTSATIALRDGKYLDVLGFLAVDPTHDLALLKTEAFDEPKAAPLAKALPGIGAKVAAFGNPRGLSFSTSEGIVSAIRSGKEVGDALGEDEYRAMGYAIGATWIQTTAPISPGNSGGPLVNMEAEVVGLNTWHFVHGQNLNFAIALPDIEKFLRTHRSDKPRPLTALPRRARIQVPVIPLEPLVKLPNGKVLSESIFEIDKATFLAAERSKNKIVFNYPNGSLQAAAEERAGKLHGFTIGQYESEMPMIIAHYLDGARHGLLKTWNEQGERMLFAQYEKGRRNGFLCFFDKDQLVLVVYYDHDRPEWIQLMADYRPLEGFDSPEKAEKNAQAKKLLDKLAAYETALKRDEYKFKMTLREIEMDRRRLRAAALAPEKRARIQARMDARSAASDAVIQSMYRKAYGR